MKYDFEGYATKHNLKCSDGVTIREKAFAHCDGKTVPIVYNHSHDDPDNVLGHGLLEYRTDGVYVYGSFNDTAKAKTVKTQLSHGDYNALSIYANRLVKQGDDVMHGEIREVSIVLVGANPGATIEKVSLAHGDGTFTESDDSFVMHMDAEGSALKHAEEKAEDDNDSDKELTQEEMQEIYEGMSDAEKTVMQAVVGQAIKDTETRQNGKKDDNSADGAGDGNVEHSDNGGKDTVRHNVFEQDAKDKDTLAHSETIKKFATTVWNDVRNKKMTFKESFIAHAQNDEELKGFLQHDGYEYGISNIEILFPEAKTSSNTPDFLKRDTGWIGAFINGTKKRPFTKLKMRHADLTEDEARAKGYITGNRKTEEVFAILQRTTDATTIYKKQKLDRDNILDASDFDLVAWMWGEMRMMLDEEIAVAALLSDGRPALINGQVNPDKVDETKIRPIWKEDELYAHVVALDMDPTYTDPSTSGPAKFVDSVIKTRKFYKGTGLPTMYTTADVISELLLMKDSLGHYIYETVDAIKNKLRVSAIYEVEQMEGLTTKRKDGDTEYDSMLAAILVNPTDYEIGTNKGGQITSFNQFDIDYNQEKMLLETRMSGSLTKAKTALIYEFRPVKAVGDYKNNYFSGKEQFLPKSGTEEEENIGG